MTLAAPSPWRGASAALPGVLIGTATQLQQSALDSEAVYAIGLALGLGLLLSGLVRRSIQAPYWMLAVAWALAAALAGWGQAGLRASNMARHALPPALEGRDVLVTGVVVGLPQRTDLGLRFRLRIEDATLDGRAVAFVPLVDVGWYGGRTLAGPSTLLQQETAPPAVAALNRVPEPVLAGERWRLVLRAKAPHGARNPHGFDYELWLWEQGVQASAYVRASARDPAPQRLGQTWTAPVAWARQQVRDRIMAAVDERSRAGVIAALVVGDQSAIERADWDIFRATGVAHLMSISGLHVTLFAWAMALALGWLWRRSARLCRWVPAPSAASLGGLLLALAYAVFAGWGVPAQRTVWMLALVTLLRLVGVRWPWPLVWLLACALVATLDPWALLQPGFWLSFVAVGVLIATDAGTRTPPTVPGSAWQGRLAQWWLALRRLGREQVVMSLALAPLSLLLFGQWSLVGLIANLVAIPWVTLVTVPLSLGGVAWSALWQAADLSLAVLMQGLQWAATWPGATLSLPLAPWWVGLAALAGGLALALPWPWTLRALGLPLLAPLLLWRAPLPPEGGFELLAADVGQGNAVLVRTARHALLYDTGPRYSLESDAGHRVLVPLLRALDVRLDLLVLSHRDTDHTGGALSVLAQQPQAAVLASLDASELQLPAGHGLSLQRCVAGHRWHWDGVDFEVLHPEAGDYGRGPRPNALSCVVRIAAGDQVALLVGDIEHQQEAALLQRAPNLRARWLLVPHHGSRTSSSAAWLDAIAPQYAVAQAGYRNRFGHPAPQVVERYQQQGVTLQTSPQCGASIWQSWRPDPPLCWREHTRRYWHHQLAAFSGSR